MPHTSSPPTLVGPVSLPGSGSRISAHSQHLMPMFSTPLSAPEYEKLSWLPGWGHSREPGAPLGLGPSPLLPGSWGLVETGFSYSPPAQGEGLPSATHMRLPPAPAVLQGQGNGGRCKTPGCKSPWCQGALEHSPDQQSLTAEPGQGYQHCETRSGGQPGQPGQ